ncbi:MAG: hypothetical protein [Podoviridae sp. ctg2L5]|nr:MAG: hypothetical protein [Podoviridae sp. ctg2L5]
MFCLSVAVGLLSESSDDGKFVAMLVSSSHTYLMLKY